MGLTAIILLTSDGRNRTLAQTVVGKQSPKPRCNRWYAASTERAALSASRVTPGYSTLACGSPWRRSLDIHLRRFLIPRKAASAASYSAASASIFASFPSVIAHRTVLPEFQIGRAHV